MKRFLFFVLILMASTVNAVVIEDFEDGVFLDGSPVNWYCPSFGDYHCHYEISSGYYARNGNYSVRIGAPSEQASKYAIDLTEGFQYETWHGAWMMEQGEPDRGDHSMFELYASNSFNLVSVIREINGKFQVFSSSGYLPMNGENCGGAVSESWYFMRLKMHNDFSMDAEVYDELGRLICSKYNYQPLLSVEPDSLRLLGDQLVPYTYWDDVVIGDEIPLGGSPPVEPPPVIEDNSILITNIPIGQVDSLRVLLVALFQLIGLDVVVQ